MKHRTFVAVAASPDIRQSVEKLVTALRPSAEGVKWVEQDNLHWTLQFLGDIDELDTPEVCKAVAKGADEVESFALEARGAGAFPAIDRPRTLWIGAGEGARQMVALQKAIRRRLAKRGYRGEQRQYVPHLTIGRAGRGTSYQALAAELPKHADYEAGNMLVEEVTVYVSRLGCEGPTYEVLAHAPLSS